jgi:hypothetical protein
MDDFARLERSIKRMEKFPTKYLTAAVKKGDKAYNEQLAKTSKGGKRSYYPASQEFGWIKKDGTKVPGKHFIRDAGDSNEGKFQKTVIDTMMVKIAKEWKHG